MALYRLINGRGKDLRLELLSPSRAELMAEAEAQRAERAAFYASPKDPCEQSRHSPDAPTAETP